MTAADFAWAAGLFEGEGSIMARIMNSGKRVVVQRRNLLLCLTTTDEDVLLKFKEIVGIGGIVGPLWDKNPAHKPYWRWSVTGRKAEALADQLLPYLGKRRAATLVAKRIEISESNPEKRSTRWNERLRDKETGRYVG